MKLPLSKIKKLVKIAEEVEKHGMNKMRIAMWGGEIK
jgi:hypothetical protein